MAGWMTCTPFLRVWRRVKRVDRSGHTFPTLEGLCVTIRNCLMPGFGVMLSDELRREVPSSYRAAPLVAARTPLAPKVLAAPSVKRHPNR